MIFEWGLILTSDIMLKTFSQVASILALFFAGLTWSFAQSPNLEIEQLTENTFRHITYLQTEDFGKVACNGMIFVSDGEALIVDAPSRNEDSEELIAYVQKELRAKVIGVVATHFHIDCLGGLDAFHQAGIPSYSYYKTVDLAKEAAYSIPQQVFETKKTLQVGSQEVILDFLGEGHTRDNSLVYIPSNRVLFGGCLIKTLGAGEGNLEDANIEAWPQTMEAILMHYQQAEVIIPGHGKTGDQELIRYTQELFSKK